MTKSENIQQAAKTVATWPTWKTQNIKAVFSEPDIKVPEDLRDEAVVNEQE